MSAQPAYAADHRARDFLRRGFEALNAGRLEQASACCREVLTRHPDLVPGHFLVGLVALALNDQKTAIQAFGSVTRLKSDHAAAWAQLAQLFMKGGQARRADEALANAVAHECGDEPAVHDMIGRVHSQLGDQEEAERWYAKAVGAEPEQVGFRVNLANALVFLGRTEDAARELDRVLDRQPGNAQAHWLKSGLNRATDDTHIETLRGLSRQAESHPQSAAFLNYALGKELEDLERWPEAFAAFNAGARARRPIVAYDEDNEAGFFTALETTYTAEWLAGQPPGCQDNAPIFVVGQPRTGTTLVERIISAHSRVHSAGEMQHFGHALRRLSRHDGEHRYSAELAVGSSILDPKQVGDAYLRASQGQRGGALRFVDKLPSNYLFIPLILAALPNARIVHLVRDPRDACFSVYKQLFADAYPHSYDLQEMGRHFARYHRLMAIWRERFPGRFLDIHYEDVVSDLDHQSRRLIDHLGLEWEPACLDFHRQRAAVATASAVQVRQPAHTRSVGRWQRYAKELAPLIQTLEAEGVIAPSPHRPKTGVPT